MKKTKVPFLFGIMVIILSLIVIFDEGEQDVVKHDKQEKGLTKGDNVSTFEEISKKLNDDDILVTVNGKPLTLKQAKENASREISDGNARSSKYVTEDEVKREISQFISYEAFYEAYPISDEELTSEKKVLEQKLITKFGKEKAHQYMPNDEIIKYNIAEKYFNAKDMDETIEELFYNSLSFVEVLYSSEILKEYMSNLDGYPYIKDFL